LVEHGTSARFAVEKWFRGVFVVIVHDFKLLFEDASQVVCFCYIFLVFVALVVLRVTLVWGVALIRLD
jgi:hypothetical protein